LIPKSLKKL